MPKTKSEAKNAILYLRLTNTIKSLITYQAAQEGITPSEWLRKLIVKELRERDALPSTFKVPQILREQNDQ